MEWLITGRASWLLVLLVFVPGCDKWPWDEIPAPPGVFQCVVRDRFYCVHTETKERRIYALDDPQMQGAQALSAEDFKASQTWITKVLAIARERCSSDAANVQSF
jgi:hypothetical protein